MPGEKIIAARRKNRSAARFAGRVQRFLKSGRVIGLAVARSAKIANGKEICQFSARPDAGQKQPENRETVAAKNGNHVSLWLGVLFVFLVFFIAVCSRGTGESKRKGMSGCLFLWCGRR